MATVVSSSPPAEHFELALGHLLVAVGVKNLDGVLEIERASLVDPPDGVEKDAQAGLRALEGRKAHDYAGVRRLVAEALRAVLEKGLEDVTLTLEGARLLASAMLAEVRERRAQCVGDLPVIGARETPEGILEISLGAGWSGTRTVRLHRGTWQRVPAR